MARRGNGEGCIVPDPRKNGKYIGRLQIGYNPNGNPKIKSFSGKTVSEVRKKMRQYKREMDGLDAIKQADGLLVEGMRLWLKTHKQPYLKPSSYDRLVQTAECRIFPYLGDYPIKSITADDIQGLIVTLKNEGLSRSSVKKVKEALNGYFKQLVFERKIPFNPVAGVRLPPKDDFEIKQIRALTADEMERFTMTATSKCAGIDEYRYRYGFGFVFMLYTGLREGEALGLQYKHIDFDKKTVRIEQNLVMATDGNGSRRRPIIQRSTKTAAGVRTIPLCDKAYEAISAYRDLYYRGSEYDFVFSTDSGKHLTPHNLAKSVNAVFRASGIPASGLHILRHSFASWMFENGVDVKLISRILGHSGVQITYDTYVHESFDQLRDAVKDL